MNYEVKIWHRGWADWPWRLRIKDEGGGCEDIARGVASNRENAKRSAEEAMEFHKLGESAKWVKIG